MSQIITPSGAPAGQPQQPTDEENIGEQLDINVATRIAGALDQLNQLESQTVVTATGEATKRALRIFLSKSFQRHGPELLGAFFSLKGEYEPLIGAVAILMRRVNATVNHMRAQEQAQRVAMQKAIEAQNKEAAPAQEAAAPAPAPSC